LSYWPISHIQAYTSAVSFSAYFVDGSLSLPSAKLLDLELRIAFRHADFRPIVALAAFGTFEPDVLTFAFLCHNACSTGLPASAGNPITFLPMASTSSVSAYAPKPGQGHTLNPATGSSLGANLPPRVSR
jgi:hypothetical protein